MRTNDLLEIIKKRVPDFKLLFKDDSKFLNILSRILRFNAITVGKKVYLPISREEFEKNPNKYFYTLVHEYCHVVDFVNHPVLFVMGYFFPQLLALLSILSIFYFPMIFFLMFLLPFPAPFRAWIELRSYELESNAYLLAGFRRDEVLKMCEKCSTFFSGFGYYFMFPFRNYISKKLAKHLDDNRILNQAFYDVYNYIKNENI